MSRCLLQHWACTLQGPAVWSLRAQTDKYEYSQLMRNILEDTPNLELREGQAVDVMLGRNDEVTGVRTFNEMTFRCKAAVLTTGTFMNGRIWVGRQSQPAGRCDLCHSALQLCSCLRAAKKWPAATHKRPQLACIRPLSCC